MSIGSSDLPPAPPEGVPTDPSTSVAPVHRTVRLPSWPFVRSDTDRYLGGVAGGLADRFDVDPLFFRVGLVAGTLLMLDELHAVLSLAYLAAWVMVPLRGGRSLLGTIRTRGSLQEVALAVGAAVLFITVLGNSALVVPGIFLAIAAALLSRRPDGTRRVDVSEGVRAVESDEAATFEPGPPLADRPAPTHDPRATAATWGRSLRQNAAERANGRERPPRKPRREPGLWPMTFAMLFVFAVIVLIIDSTLSGGLDPSISVNGALLIIGAIIVLAGWRGRAKMTALLLLPLIPPWIAFSVADVGRFQGEGLLDETPTNVPDGGLWFERGYGALDVDLTELALSANDQVDVHVSVTAGTARLVVPHDAEILVNAHVGLGLYDVSAPRSYLSDEEPASDRTFDRLYPALGTNCEIMSVESSELDFLARQAGVEFAGGSTIEDLADAIDRAGYRRPIRELTEIYSQSGRELFDEDGRQLSGAIELRTADIVAHYEGGQLAEPDDIIRYDYWTVDTDWRGGLCIGADPPSDPARIMIDATIGLGRLEIVRDSTSFIR